MSERSELETGLGRRAQQDPLPKKRWLEDFYSKVISVFAPPFSWVIETFKELVLVEPCRTALNKSFARVLTLLPTWYPRFSISLLYQLYTASPSASLV